MFEEIKNIDIYGDCYTVLDTYYPETVEAMDADHLCVLRHFNDFESVMFCVINDKAVLTYDGLCGDVIGRFESLEDFRDAVLQEVGDEVA